MCAAYNNNHNNNYTNQGYDYHTQPVIKPPVGKLAGILSKSNANSSSTTPTLISVLPQQHNNKNQQQQYYNNNNNNNVNHHVQQSNSMLPPAAKTIHQLPTLSSTQHHAQNTALSNNNIHNNTQQQQLDTHSIDNNNNNNVSVSKTTTSGKQTNGLPNKITDQHNRPSRVNTSIYKQRVEYKLGPTKSKTYWKLITRYFYALISKREFDQNIIDLFDDVNNIYLHNDLFMAVLQNIYSNELPDMTQRNKQQQQSQTNIKQANKQVSPKQRDSKASLKQQNQQLAQNNDNASVISELSVPIQQASTTTTKTTKTKQNNSKKRQLIQLQVSDDDNMSIKTDDTTTVTTNNNKQSTTTTSNKNLSPRKKAKLLPVDDYELQATQLQSTVVLTHKSIYHITSLSQYIQALHDTNVELSDALIYGPVANLYKQPTLSIYANQSQSYITYKQHIYDNIDNIEDEFNNDFKQFTIQQQQANRYILHNNNNNTVLLPTRDQLRHVLYNCARDNNIKKVSETAITTIQKASYAYLHTLIETLIGYMNSNNNNNNLHTVNTVSCTTQHKPIVRRRHSYLNYSPYINVFDTSNTTMNNITTPIKQEHNTDTQTNSSSVSTPNTDVSNTVNANTTTTQGNNLHNSTTPTDQSNATLQQQMQQLSIDADDVLFNHEFLDYIDEFESHNLIDSLIATR